MGYFVAAVQLQGESACRRAADHRPVRARSPSAPPQWSACRSRSDPSAGALRDDRVRVASPGEQLILARPADQIVGALAAEDHVPLAGRARGAAVAPQPVVAAEAVDHVAAVAAVDPVAGLGDPARYRCPGPPSSTPT